MEQMALPPGLKATGVALSFAVVGFTVVASKSTVLKIATGTTAVGTPLLLNRGTVLLDTPGAMSILQGPPRGAGPHAFASGTPSASASAAAYCAWACSGVISTASSAVE